MTHFAINGDSLGGIVVPFKMFQKLAGATHKELFKNVAKKQKISYARMQSTVKESVKREMVK